MAQREHSGYLNGLPRVPARDPVDTEVADRARIALPAAPARTRAQRFGLCRPNRLGYRGDSHRTHLGAGPARRSPGKATNCSSECPRGTRSPSLERHESGKSGSLGGMVPSYATRPWNRSGIDGVSFSSENADDETTRTLDRVIREKTRGSEGAAATPVAMSLAREPEECHRTPIATIESPSWQPSFVSAPSAT